MSPAPALYAPEAATLTPADLAELLASFNAAAARLQATHETLTAEVARLKGELGAAREQAARSQRLAALGEMAAGIAHEVRNPLGSIRLYARMLQHDLADRPEPRRLAERIGQAVAGLDGVVGDVLSFARDLRVRAELIRADELFDCAWRAARGEGAMWTGLAVHTVAAGTTIFCDAALMQQALVNLIRNAAEAMADNPPERPRVLTLEARATRAADPAGGAARLMHALVVADTGPGLAPDTMQRMFNPFFTTRAAGTGLGLAIVHRIVDAHGGRIGVSNGGGGSGGCGGDGGGARIEVLLPDDSEAAPPGRAA